MKRLCRIGKRVHIGKRALTSRLLVSWLCLITTALLKSWSKYFYSLRSEEWMPMLILTLSSPLKWVHRIGSRCNECGREPCGWWRSPVLTCHLATRTSMNLWWAQTYPPHSTPSIQALFPTLNHFSFQLETTRCITPYDELDLVPLKLQFGL